VQAERKRKFYLQFGGGVAVLAVLGVLEVLAVLAVLGGWGCIFTFFKGAVWRKCAIFALMYFY
jgi:hypothetical protein